MEWIKSEVESPPKDKLFWAWLYKTGIRPMFWASPRQVADHHGWDVNETEGRYVEESNISEEWCPEYWTPFDSIPKPHQ